MKLTRFSFLAALFGIPAAAQQDRSNGPVTDPIIPPSTLLPECVWGYDLSKSPCGVWVSGDENPKPRWKPKNGQCPIPECGEMAPKFTGVTNDEDLKSGKTALIFSFPDLPLVRLNRCARCSVAFYQDAEEK